MSEWALIYLEIPLAGAVANSKDPPNPKELDPDTPTTPILENQIKGENIVRVEKTDS